MSTTATIDLQAGRYRGDDIETGKALAEVRSNWTRLKNQLTEGGLPSLMARITSAYSSGYSWEEVYETASGTFSTLVGGRAAGSGGYPKAFETNGGTADFTNAIVELRPSSDVGAGSVTTISFDGKSVRVAAQDVVNPVSVAFDNTSRVFTLVRLTTQYDLFGRKVGTSSPADLTVTIPAGTGGGFDAYQEASLVEAAVTKISIPTTNGASTILEFVDDASATQIKLQMKTGAQYKVPVLNGSGNWTIDWVRFH